MSITPLLAESVVESASSAELLEAAGVLMVRAFEVICGDAPGLTRDELLAQVEAVQRVANSVDGARVVRMAQVASIEDVTDLSGETEGPPVTSWVRHQLGWTNEWVSSEIGALLAWGPRQADTRLDQALDAVTLTPRLLREVGAGRLAAEKMHKVTAGLGSAPTDVAAAVESALLDQGIGGLTTTQIARRVPRILADLDPTAAETSGTKTREREVGVSCRASHVPGLSEIKVVLDSAQAARIMSAVEQLARQLHHDAVEVISLPQCRVDALVDLVLQNVHIDTHLTFQVPVMTGVFPADTTSAASVGDTTATTTGTGAATAFDAAAACATATGSASAAAGVAGTVTGGAVVGGAVVGDGSDTARARVAALCDRLFPDPHTMGWTQVHRCENDPPPPDDQDGWTHGMSPEPPDDVFDDDPDHEIDWDTALAHLVESLPDPPLEGVFTADPHFGDYPDIGAPTDLVTVPNTANLVAPSRHVMPSASAPAIAGVGPVIVPGVGTILPSHVHALTSTLGVSLARTLLDATTGVLVQATSTKYRPTAGIARFVKDRDQHCRFPGCTQPATYCDADHVTPWPGGATTPANLQCLCRHHHRVKHQTRWQVTMTTKGVCTWTSPGGREYLTRPAD
ncbi:HNH endonuclease signature motif containing protein [Rudaeicoccus suwonensis]|uniref:HNH endonuclease n=1 Tax=Rudaeicoccus suwonensis TaxID=657409 RepID=A0A561E3K7_9MICO|nr:HNH endonuclease signature motif containing protein [Rudaeicoccus suwonensis]TWE10179.1 HNH endonuclease [Rudaeicoccus suwonensis]